MVEINRSPGVVGFDAASAKPRGVVSPTDHRLGISPLAVRPGIFRDRPTPARIVTSTTSRDVQIMAATVAISAPLGGYYLPSWRSTLSLPIAVAGSQDRIDVVVVSQRDHQVDATQTASLAEVSVITGVSSATPVAPTVGTGQLALYAVRVPAGATNSAQYVITQMAGWTAPLGGVVPVSSETELGSLPLIDGLRAARVGSLDEWTLRGGVWRRWSSDPVGASQISGAVTVISAPRIQLLAGTVHVHASFAHIESSGGPVFLLPDWARPPRELTISQPPELAPVGPQWVITAGGWAQYFTLGWPGGSATLLGSWPGAVV